MKRVIFQEEENKLLLFCHFLRCGEIQWLFFGVGCTAEDKCCPLLTHQGLHSLSGHESCCESFSINLRPYCYIIIDYASVYMYNPWLENIFDQAAARHALCAAHRLIPCQWETEAEEHSGDLMSWLPTWRAFVDALVHNGLDFLFLLARRFRLHISLVSDPLSLPGHSSKSHRHLWPPTGQDDETGHD